MFEISESLKDEILKYKIEKDSVIIPMHAQLSQMLSWLEVNIGLLLIACVVIQLI